MKMFDALARLLGSRPKSDRDLDRLTETWGLGEAMEAADHGGPMPTGPDDAVAYDRAQWIRRLKRVLDALPASEGEWAVVQADGRALGLDPDWLARQYREEFDLLVRRVIADGVFTLEEKRKLMLARDLIGLTEPEAEATLQAIVAEAEAFFGKPIEGP